jgi:RsiW-degrading membrane proteinase PrsW (M82 family)
MDLMSVVVLAAVLALVPTMLYAILIWWLDRYEKEPLPLLGVAFLWGALPAIILALILELSVGVPLEQIIISEQTREFTEASLIAPIVEEAVKAVILVVLFLAYRREFDNVLDGIVYGAMVGLGFAFVENVLYLTSVAVNVPEGTPPDIGGMVGLWVLRAGLFGLNHSMFTAFTGAALGLARSLRRGWQQGLVPALGLGMAMIFHALHNGLVSMVALFADSEADESLVLGACLGALISDYGGILLALVLAIISGTREKRIIQDTLWEEVALGRLAQDEYHTLISGRRRWGVRWMVLFTQGFGRWRQIGRFFDLATELAFRKHQMRDADPVLQNLCARDIARLRQHIDNLKWSLLSTP